MPIENHLENIIELTDIHFAYGDDVILNGIDLEVHRGDYVGIIGPNGSGKSTLIKIMLGLLPTSGQIKLFGQNIKDFKDWSKFAYVSQKATNVDPGFPITVKDVVSMGRYAKKRAFQMLDKEDGAKVAQALEYVGMSGYADRLIGNLSGGQQQRVFVARALVGDPEIIVLDEPTIGIDVTTREHFYALLRKLNKEKHLTLILVSHDMDVIEKEATELVCINKSLVYCGLPEEFKTHERFAEFYKEHNHH